MRALRLACLPLVALLVAGCPSLAEKPAPEPVQLAPTPVAAAPTQPAAAAPSPHAAGGCGCGSADQAGGCGPGAAAAEPASECGGACSGEASGGCGCGGQAKAAAAGGPLVAPARAAVGDRTKCIVSGGAFVVTPTTQWVTHGDQRFPVCCPACVARFNANPARFLGT
ncbi:MAG: hypothetical protein IT376_14515 [Polyangiaceae bacterium]|nr:hypothetical protein [Polyangiaceae bacterium]